MKTQLVNENSFSFERLCTKTRFEKEVQDNSEMAYWSYPSVRSHPNPLTPPPLPSGYPTYNRVTKSVAT